MTRSILTALLCVVSLVPALGKEFVGTIQGTLTALDDPFGVLPYHEGGTFIGWYSYESPTIDGAFYGRGLGAPNATLDGQFLTMLFPASAGAWLSGLAVSGGVVTEVMVLGVYPGAGFVDTYMASKEAFLLTRAALVEGVEVQGSASGTLSFSAPRALPEAGATLGLLSLALLAGGLGPRKTRRT